MKTFLVFFLPLLILISCKDSVISEPDNLIAEDTMINIIYDLALLEGVKTYNSSSYQSLKSNDFVYKKYKIDSLQFAKSTQFYTADINRYKKMYEEVVKRIESNKIHIDSVIGKESKNHVLPKKVNQSQPVIE